VEATAADRRYATTMTSCASRAAAEAGGDEIMGGANG